MISIGGSSFSLTPPNSQGYTLTTLFLTNVSGQLSFTNRGPSDQQGNLIDNIVVTTGVPEPSTWAMMGSVLRVSASPRSVRAVRPLSRTH